MREALPDSKGRESWTSERVWKLITSEKKGIAINAIP